MFICDKVEMNVFKYATEILPHAIPTGVAYFEGKIRIIYTTQLKKWCLN